MKKSLLLAALTLGAATLAAGPAQATGRFYFGRGLVVVGLTADQRLIAFHEYLPLLAGDIGPVTNLSGDAKLVGIDFRPATGDLYGLGDAGGVYSIDAETGVATFRAQLSANGQPLALSGTAFGIDFNPTVDRLRVVSDNGQNLRINVDTGATTIDTLLTYVGPPPVTALGVAAAAYTNNDADPATATTLFDIDTTLDQVVIQAPPNAGSLNPTGKLGLDTSAAAGFDIYSRLQDGVTVTNDAFASLTTDRARFYAIELTTGKATSRGSFSRRNQVVDIAIPTDQP